MFISFCLSLRGKIFEVAFRLCSDVRVSQPFLTRNFFCFGYKNMAAYEGAADLSTCRWIIDNVVDKNPKNKWEQTPLHQAARNGHLPVYQCFSDKTTVPWTLPKDTAIQIINIIKYLIKDTLINSSSIRILSKLFTYKNSVFLSSDKCF